VLPRPSSWWGLGKPQVFASCMHLAYGMMLRFPFYLSVTALVALKWGWLSNYVGIRSHSLRTITFIFFFWTLAWTPDLAMDQRHCARVSAGTFSGSWEQFLLQALSNPDTVLLTSMGDSRIKLSLQGRTTWWLHKNKKCIIFAFSVEATVKSYSKIHTHKLLQPVLDLFF